MEQAANAEFSEQFRRELAHVQEKVGHRDLPDMSIDQDPSDAAETEAFLNETTDSIDATKEDESKKPDNTPVTSAATEGGIEGVDTKATSVAEPSDGGDGSGKQEQAEGQEGKEKDEEKEGEKASDTVQEGSDKDSSEEKKEGQLACSKCGAGHAADDVFCRKCGNRVASDDA
eukprot:TRINITY_DN33215_c0_g1_i1.p1 TRINITY_DN33215_c0_g1~~TRINITY_DN33215_c0_g1_i1.p1  ORF type:complete len:173 (+),score=43.52 TRINITY_DN33215_c0_g1_i1:1-519(+)